MQNVYHYYGHCMFIVFGLNQDSNNYVYLVMRQQHYNQDSKLTILSYLLQIFPINLKGLAGSIVTVVNWFGSWIISYSFNFFMQWTSEGIALFIIILFSSHHSNVQGWRAEVNCTFELQKTLYYPTNSLKSAIKPFTYKLPAIASKVDVAFTCNFLFGATYYL